jgi:hypothetical protein
MGDWKTGAFPAMIKSALAASHSKYPGKWSRSKPDVVGVDRYDYYIEINEISPPQGGFRYVAKIGWMVKNPGPGRQHVFPQLSEQVGVTETEAQQKMRAEADRWIADQGGEKV